MRFIKNFIYNFSDIFVALIIIALAAFLIWTRIDVILAYPDSDTITPTKVSEVTEKDSANTADTTDTATEETESNGIPEVSYVKKIETAESSYKEVGIAQGTSTEAVAELLKQNSVISDMSYFIAQLREKKFEGQIDPGVYKIPKGISVDELINILCKKTSANTDTHKISIPAGSSTEVVAGLLKQSGVIAETNHFTTQIKTMNLDGQIEPGYYQIPVGVSMEELINILCKKQ